ncbi:M48 family metalloprotease [Streptomyces roseoverticillatus]|uniref:M48 family metalloprotease n=1 Tax=Streptomyces roseoverticillatus TaxID=66429 RepID=UPI0006946990|nr:M48 family metalloprotease [Streptomyces roseoverticillatus]
MPPRPELPPSVAVNAVGHDDLTLQSGRKHLKAYQRGVDGAALSQLVVTIPTALISLAVVSFASSLLNPVLGLVLPVVWLLSGPLVFHRSAEAAIARYVLRMRRPTPAEAERLSAVWEEVTRRAGVNQGTYELWVQERAELNATAAAGHIVGVTRHALERLPNSRLAAVLAHELGHHVGGHTWAGMLADWYALPARTVWRLITTGLLLLLGSRNVAGIACGGCLSVTFVWFVYVLTFTESMWWLTLPVAIGPFLVAWLHRRAECRADDYAAGLGFGDELMAVLAEEHQARTMPPVPAAPPVPPTAPAPYGTYGPPAPPDAPPAPPRPAEAEPAAHPAVRGAHSRFEARLQHLQRKASARHRLTGRP